MIHFEIPETQNSIVKIIGIGGGGSNAVSHMQELGADGVDLIICNTDSQALSSSPVSTKIQLGPYITQGLGAGANPEVGEKAAEESIDELKRILETNTKMVFITAGMGGGTGTGGAPIVARICKEMDILTVAIVTTPFFFEGKKRMKHALEGIEKLKETVDTIIVISNDKLREQCGDLKFLEAFSKADGILATAANCITSVIKKHDRVNTDFADVNTVMRNGGVAILGRASAGGENRAIVATEEALTSPLLNNNDIAGAKWLLVNISSSKEHAHTMDEMAIIENYLSEQAGDDCNVILGMGIDENLGEELSVTIIATGFAEDDLEEPHTEKMKQMRNKNRTLLSLDDETPVEVAPTPVDTDQVTANFESPTEQPNMEPAPEARVDEDVELRDISVEQPLEDDHDQKIILSLEDDTPNEINVGQMIYGDEPEVSATIETDSIQQKISSQFVEEPPISNEPLAPTEEAQESPNEALYQKYGIPKKKGIKTLTEEERKDLLDFEIQKQQLENRAQGLFSLKSDISPLQVDDEKYLHDVPAIERQNDLEENENTSSEEFNEDDGHLSGYRVTDADINNNKLISSINNFLHGKKPD